MSAAHDDLLHFLGVIVIEPRSHSETRTEWSAYHSGSRGCADQRELWQIEPQTARLRSLVNDDVEPVIFHRRVEVFFDRRLQPVNLVDEEHIALFQAGEKPCEFTGFFNHRSTGVFDIHAHCVGNDVGERRLAEPRRTAQENMLGHVTALFSRFDHQLQPFAHLYLAGELAECRRSQRNFKSSIWLRRFHVQALIVNRYIVKSRARDYSRSGVQSDSRERHLRVMPNSSSTPARCHAVFGYNRPDQTRSESSEGQARPVWSGRAT